MTALFVSIRFAVISKGIYFIIVFFVQKQFTGDDFMQRIYDTVIIGGGPAGYSAALYACRGGLDTLVLEKMSAGGQMALTGEIDNYPGFDEGIDGFTLGMKMENGAKRFGAESKYGDVVSVNFTASIKEITASDAVYLAKTVIICAGADPKKLGLSNENKFIGKGVHYCAHCDGRFYKDKIVAVVGGGNTAAADVLYMAKVAKKVYIIHRRDKMRAERFYQNALMKAENVEFLWNSTVKELIGDERINAIELEDTKTGERKTVECAALFVSIGREPNTAFLNGRINTDKSGYIVADETTKTNIPGVFAAGDIRQKPLRQVVTAAADGAVAAHFAQEYLSAE